MRSARSSSRSPCIAACRPASTHSASRARRSPRSTRSKIRVAMKRTLLFVALVALAIAPLAGQAQQPAAPKPAVSRAAAKAGYKAPRTAWGDPDLQGVWPGTDYVGVPLQRASQFGSRNTLTEEEFNARQAAAARQTDEDNAEFNIDAVTSDQEARGAVGGPVSPPPHWLERG